MKLPMNSCQYLLDGHADENLKPQIASAQRYIVIYCFYLYFLFLAEVFDVIRAAFIGIQNFPARRSGIALP
ncbi:MAG TPA: hypothetical protein VLT92_00815 [Burkholderiales bacterium]|nr:hypothetical protein [Burkholderiales bacterium]